MEGGEGRGREGGEGRGEGGREVGERDAATTNHDIADIGGKSFCCCCDVDAKEVLPDLHLDAESLLHTLRKSSRISSVLEMLPSLSRV